MLRQNASKNSLTSLSPKTAQKGHDSTINGEGKLTECRGNFDAKKRSRCWEYLQDCLQYESEVQCRILHITRLQEGEACTPRLWVVTDKSQTERKTK